MKFQTKEVKKKKNSKHLKQNITVSSFDIKFFSHGFVAFGVQNSLVNH